MQGIYNQEFNPNSTVTSPQSLRQLYRQNSASERCASSFSTVTPCGSGTSIMDQWMARCMGREADNIGNAHISPIERAEVSRAVYNVLRDNLPPALETQTSQEELTYVADSIERKLYQTASSPRAYCALGTLELRITALATAVLIHSDRGQEDYNGYQVVSDTCARLSAAARRSLVYCVMVLISYEKRNLDEPIQRRRMAKIEKKKNLGYLQGQEGYLQGQEGSSTNEMMKEMYSQYAAEYHLHQQAECPSFDGNPHRAEYCQFEKMTPSASIDHSAGDDLDNRGDSEQVQPFPPSA